MSRHLATAAAAAFALALLVVPTSARAAYLWTPDQIQGLADVTDAFHGGAGQLSTIDSITHIPGGIELEVTFRVGQDADPFGPNYGLTFARVSLSASLGSPGFDASAFTGSSVLVTTTTDFTAQSFLMTDFTENGGSIDDGDAIPGESFTFLFWEHNDAVAAGGPAPVQFEFNAGSEFDGNWNLASPQQVVGTDAIRNWGIQFGKFSGVSIEQPVTATIRLTNPAEAVVPEPASATIAIAGALALLTSRRRR